MTDGILNSIFGIKKRSLQLKLFWFFSAFPYVSMNRSLLVQFILHWRLSARLRQLQSQQSCFKPSNYGLLPVCCQDVIRLTHEIKSRFIINASACMTKSASIAKSWLIITDNQNNISQLLVIGFSVDWLHIAWNIVIHHCVHLVHVFICCLIDIWCFVFCCFDMNSQSRELCTWF